MKGYGTREVAKMLGLSVGQVRSSVRLGFLSPGRGPRGEWCFSFQDLVLLRAAKDLRAARIAPGRIRSALQTLRGKLPPGRSLTGLHFSADGRRIVVADGTARWQPETGQILFDFGVAELAKKVAPLARQAFLDAGTGAERLSAQDWYEWGCELEVAAPAEAREAYRCALSLDPTHADAHVNLGRLLHEAGDAAAARKQYRLALASRPEDATAVFNLGVALEDLGRPGAALEAYKKAVTLDPDNADAHYNVANLYERVGQTAAALRHLKAYRKLIRGRTE